MNPRTFIAAISLSTASLAHAQHVSEEPAIDPVLEAIQEFNRRDSKEEQEVKVILPPPEDAPIARIVRQEEEAGVIEPSEPVLVTGKPPDEAETTEPAAPAENPPAAIAPPPAAEPEERLAVRVETLHGTHKPIDATRVKLLAPFPAKPLARPPAGWRLDHPDNAPPVSRDVEIAPGSKITLTIRPHLLVPDADGASAFSVAEPGYDPASGYRQTATVGAILSTSIARLDEDSKNLGDAIDRLQQLLISLPKPEPQPEPAVVPPPAPARKR